ncbi:MAG: hypothetical protein Ct9H300mP2_2300 [Candidatus Neomarinimicrobiota bacterium]|nr:MAG: hypothetical protein Ct9H300mP2_2300 [Candidatus Neomarinimicrobiota bacterium]
MIICGGKTFPDHQNYNRLDIKKIEQRAKINGADYLITTKKDLIKLSGLKFNIPLYAVKIRLEFHPKNEIRTLSTTFFITIKSDQHPKQKQHLQM